MRNSTTGFTLIELLVVIAIIGLLSSVVLASLTSARVKARDAKRLSDLRQVKIALELFYSQYEFYPYTKAEGPWFAMWQHLQNCLSLGTDECVGGTGSNPGSYSTFMSKVPQDPSGNDDAHTYHYGYPLSSDVNICYRNSPQTAMLGYRLHATLENAGSVVLNSDYDGSFYNNGTSCADPSYCIGGGTQCPSWGN